ncbi:fimbrial protein [[Enterobacter] lignolyticus]|uniref:Fimbrial protein domain-containing protein n=1 Tax=Enterobacter lignolyticus (strain SCF1) TaxID=701347 RepID=E3GCB4_ENTLS|nr:fimbrial protein [[Enterobacter] lignolyticus]ADO49000.1 Fimbrial protein domain-containing protein [[Enterobacter] lignolyticus SCF1]
MKRAIVAAAVLSAVFASVGAFAAQETGVLTIKGAVVGNPCTFVDGKSEETVILKQISINDINNEVINSAIAKNSEETKLLTITCPTVTVNDHVNVRIVSPSMDDNGFIANQNTAPTSPQKVGFMLTGTGGGQVVNNALNAITIPGNELVGGQEYQIPLTVHYARNGDETTQGDVIATVRLEVSSD